MKVAHPTIGLLGILVVTAASAPVLAQPSPCPPLTPIVLAGQTNLAFIDTNGNMMLDASDCVLTGVGQQTGMMGSVAMGNACYTAMQGSPPFITGCNDTYPGMADLDSSSGEGSATESLGVTIMYSSDSSSPSPSPSPAIGGPGGAGGFPVPLVSASVFDEGMLLGEGMLCDAGGPAVRATVKGVSGIARFNLINIGGVVHGCAPLPFPLTTGGQATFPLCIPVGTSGSPEGGLQGGTMYITLPLNNLQGCGGFQTPSANEWGLLGLASALLVVGTWMLRRRPAFGAALPRV
jgi:hypothetical protein